MPSTFLEFELRLIKNIKSLEIYIGFPMHKKTTKLSLEFGYNIQKAEYLF